MTRNETIRKLWKMADKLVRNYSRELNSKMWDLCSDWNRDHYNGHYDEAEIFMCEVYDDDRNVIGFMIEDDVWYWPDETR